MILRRCENVENAKTVHLVEIIRSYDELGDGGNEKGRTRRKEGENMTKRNIQMLHRSYDPNALVALDCSGSCRASEEWVPTEALPITPSGCLAASKNSQNKVREVKNAHLQMDARNNGIKSQSGGNATHPSSSLALARR